MLLHFLKFTLRSTKKHPFHSIVNILGITIGLSICILLFLYVRSELSYDRFNEKADRIYRVTMKYNLTNVYNPHFARVPFGFVLSMKDDFPEVEELIRFQEMKKVVKYKETKFYETRIFRADKSVFKVFDYKLLEGDPETALNEPNSLVITEKTAKKYFGEENPFGQELTTIDQKDAGKETFKVTGVLEDIPDESHFHFDFLTSFPSEPDPSRDEWNYIYILLAEGVSANEMSSKIPGFMESKWSQYNSDFHSMPIQKLTDIHLRSKIDRELEQNSSIKYVYTAIMSAILVLLIAVINYINISTAGYLIRAKEIGVRKTLGSKRTELMKYFLLESVSMCIAGLLLSIIVVYLLIPTFNDITGKSLTFGMLFNINILLVFISGTIATGLICGIYPAVFMASLNPDDSLKSGGSLCRSRNSGLINVRKTLVVFQFAISIALIIISFVINSQLDFIASMDKGFNSKNLIAIRNLPAEIKAKLDLIENNFSNIIGVSDVSFSMEEPSKQILDAGPITIEGAAQGEQVPLIFVSPVWYNYVEFMELELLAGRGIPYPSPEDSSMYYLLNESGMKKLGIDSPDEIIGKTIKWRDIPEGKVTGIIKDYNISSVRNEVKPFALFVRPVWLWCVLIRLDDNNIPNTLANLEKSWFEMFPAYPFEFVYVDDLFDGLYSGDKIFKRIINYSSVTALFIACLGLFGLSSFIIEQKTKEIGVRKVLGAEFQSLFFMISNDFVKWIALANLIAWPPVYFLINEWLRGFAYRTEPGLSTYLISGIIAVLIAFITIAYHAASVSMSNPVKALRYE